VETEAAALQRFQGHKKESATDNDLDIQGVSKIYLQL
jgi:hypothetical protein